MGTREPSLSSLQQPFSISSSPWLWLCLFWVKIISGDTGVWLVRKIEFSGNWFPLTQKRRLWLRKWISVPIFTSNEFRRERERERERARAQEGEARTHQHRSHAPVRAVCTHRAPVCAVRKHQRCQSRSKIVISRSGAVLRELRSDDRAVDRDLAKHRSALRDRDRRRDLAKRRSRSAQRRDRDQRCDLTKHHADRDRREGEFAISNRDRRRWCLRTARTGYASPSRALALSLSLSLSLSGIHSKWK